MKIVPYEGLEGLPFGQQAHEAIELLGDPNSEEVNRGGEKVLHYDHFDLRFDCESGGFRECTLLESFRGWLLDRPIEWSGEFFMKIVALDGNPIECFGVILLLNYGVSMSGFHDQSRFDSTYQLFSISSESEKTLTIFQKGDWDEFEEDFNFCKLP